MKETIAIQRIQDLDEDTIEFHLKKSLKLKDKSGKKVATYQGAEVWQTGDQKENYLILWYNNEILYLVKSRLAKLGIERFGQQVMAIKNYNASDSTPTAGFLLWAFLKKLLPQYGLLVSDEEQTKQGESVFRFIIQAALQRRKHVYVFDRRSSPTRWLTIKRYKDLVLNASWIYGSDVGHKRVYIIISEKPVKPKSKTVVYLN